MSNISKEHKQAEAAKPSKKLKKLALEVVAKADHEAEGGGRDSGHEPSGHDPDAGKDHGHGDGDGHVHEDRKRRKVKEARLEQEPVLLSGPSSEPPAEVLSSRVVYEGPLFNVVKDEVREPNGHVSERDVIKHNGSVVILPVDASKSRKDPMIILERQYRHAAGQYLWEVPAGKIELGEDRLEGAKRELKEETGYTAETWTELVRYFASPGFLGEWMQVYLAEDLTVGTATPEEDETLEIFALPLSEVEALIDAGKVLDGKTLIAVSLYKRLRKQRKREKKERK